MPRGEAIGLPVNVPADLKQPLELAMVVKGLDDEGKVAYWTIASDAVTSIEITGMMAWGAWTALVPHDPPW